MLLQNRLALWQNARIHRYLWSIPAVSHWLWPNGIHAHNQPYPAGTRGERGDGSWCQRSTAREEGMRLEEIRMPTGLRRANGEGGTPYGLQRIIPLEELPTGTRILNMRALPEIKVVSKFPGACRATHGVIPFCWCVPLLAHYRPIIRYPSSKRSQNIFGNYLDIGMCSPYTLTAPMADLLGWEVSLHTSPDLRSHRSGLCTVSFPSPSNNFNYVTFSCNVCVGSLPRK